MAKTYKVGDIGLFKGAVVEIVAIGTTTLPIPVHNKENRNFDLLNPLIKNMPTLVYTIKVLENNTTRSYVESKFIPIFKDLGTNGRILYGK